MRIILLIGVITFTGCTSFFQGRVTKHDEAISSIQEERIFLLAKRRELKRDISSSEREGKDTAGLQRKLKELQSGIVRTEKQLEEEKGSQREALKGATYEIKYKQEMLAAILGIGATAISALVRSAKRTV